MLNPLAVIAADFGETRTGVLVTAAVIAVAVGLGVGVSAGERALREGSASAADVFDLVVGAPGSETQLLLSTVYLQPAAVDVLAGMILQELAADERVEFAAPLGFGDNFRGYPVVGTTAALLAHGTGGNAEGRAFAAVNEAVIGIDVRLRVGDRFEPVHGQVLIDPAATHPGLESVVVGRMARLGNPWDRAIVVPIEAVWWVHGLPAGHAGYEEAAAEAPAAGMDAFPIGPPWDPNYLPGVPAIVVKPASAASAFTLLQEYRGREETMAVFPAEVLIELYGLLGDVRDLVAAITVLTQILVLGAVLLAVLAALTSRRKTIAVLRALGASRRYIFVTVWLNVTLTIAVAAVLGLGVGWGAARFLAAAFADQTGLSLPVSIAGPELALTATIVLAGFVLAAVPALLTYRLSVAQALRQ